MFAALFATGAIVGIVQRADAGPINVGTLNSLPAAAMSTGYVGGVPFLYPVLIQGAGGNGLGTPSHNYAVTSNPIDQFKIIVGRDDLTPYVEVGFAYVISAATLQGWPVANFPGLGNIYAPVPPAVVGPNFFTFTYRPVFDPVYISPTIGAGASTATNLAQEMACCEYVRNQLESVRQTWKNNVNGESWSCAFWVNPATTTTAGWAAGLGDGDFYAYTFVTD